jgi:hypothetical protein
MTDHHKLCAAVMLPEVQETGRKFAEELIYSAVQHVTKNPRDFGLLPLAEHEARVTELLAANNHEVGRRRAAERRAAQAEADLQDLRAREARRREVLPINACSLCDGGTSAIASCTLPDCPCRIGQPHRREPRDPLPLATETRAGRKPAEQSSSPKGEQNNGTH